MKGRLPQRDWRTRTVVSDLVIVFLIVVLVVVFASIFDVHEKLDAWSRLHGEHLQIDELLAAFTILMVGVAVSFLHQWRRLNDEIIKRGQAEEALQQAYDDLGHQVRERTAELSQANEQLSLLIESLPTVVYMCKAEGDYGATFISSNVTAVTGYAPDDFISHSSFWADHIHPADAPRTLANLSQLFDRGQHEYEYRWRVDDGSYRWFHDVVRLVRLPGGEVSHIVGMWHDDTERKQAEQELDLGSEIIANMAEGVCLVRSSDGVIIHANPRFEEMFAYGPGELVGQHVSIVNALTDQVPEETAREIMEALRENGVWTGEIQNIRKDGTRFWCHASVTTFEHVDYGTVWLSIHQDISERKQAEEALHASEDMYRGLYESIKDGIVRVDMQGAILEVNQAYADMLGYTQEEVKHLTYQQITPPRWHEMEADIVARQIVARGYSEVYEKEYIRRDGTVFPIVLRVWLIIDRLGHHQGMWGIVRDISERKLAEAERERLIVELQAAIDKAKVLSGLIPICASCKKIRDDNGYWHQLELYISHHSDADFSHGICPDCMRKLYPGYEHK